MRRFKADYTFSHFAELTPEWLEEHQVKFILSSLNGTLKIKGQRDFTVFDQWYKQIETVGTGLIIATNDEQEEVDRFIARHKLVGYGDCRKPKAQLLEEKLFGRGLNPDTTLLLGNAVWADIRCGKHLGIRTAKVTTLRSDNSNESVSFFGNC